MKEEEQKATDQPEEEDSLLEEERATDQPEEGDSKEKATDQLAKEKDSLLEEVEEQRVADQLAEEELIERQGEFVISVLGEINMLLSIL